MTSLSKFDAAIEQLDWAIRLFFEEKAYVPAITLAGAAAGIFEGLDQSTFNKVREGLVEKFSGLSHKEAADCLNETRNSLKHADSFDRIIIDETDLEFAAALMILRAVCTYLQFDFVVASNKMIDFIRWKDETDFFKFND